MKEVQQEVDFTSLTQKAVSEKVLCCSSELWLIKRDCFVLLSSTVSCARSVRETPCNYLLRDTPLSSETITAKVFSTLSKLQEQSKVH